MSIQKVLADAFFDYPMSDWILVNARNKRKALLFLFDLLDKWVVRPTGARVLSNEERGVAVWIKSENMRSMSLHVGFLILMLFAMGCGFDAARKLFVLNRVMARYHEGFSSHYYLYLIGVAPSQRRQGVGHALLREGIRLADSDGVGVFLETSSLENVDWYRQFGFNVVDTYFIEDGSPPTWTMWRNPQI